MIFTPTKIDKPWGYELLWAKTDRYVGKILHINKGESLSLQYHNKKDETQYVLAGKIRLEVEEAGTLVPREMGPGDAYHLTPAPVRERQRGADILESAGAHFAARP